MSDREEMQYDVIIVGAGPAGLACATRLKQAQPDLQVCVIEKGSEVGAHILSGAVIEPGPLAQLHPDWLDSPPAICVPAQKDRFYWLGKNRRQRLPTPPQIHNKGNYIVSLGSLCSWLAERAENIGVDIFPGYPAKEAIIGQQDQVRGVRIGDMGIARDGSKKSSYTEGVDILAATTVLAEGCRGHISKKLIQHFNLDRDSQPQTYGIGLKELWQVPEGRVEPGLIEHTIGWPLDSQTYGGSFTYHLNQNRIAIGFIVGLDYRDPMFSPFEAFQAFKNHAAIRPLLEGGNILSSGARALIEGGYQSLPRLEMPGALLIGDAAGMMNVPKIKGTHMAMRSGILAAEHILDSGQGTGFDARFRASKAFRELKKVRNIRPGFKPGLVSGLLNASLETLTAGLLPWTLKHHTDHEMLAQASDSEAQATAAQPTLAPKDRLASVYFSATAHEEDQPVHLLVKNTDICVNECREKYANPCTRFCPANVYEMLNDNGTPRLQINAANCVHCKTCDIKDPYQIIDWTSPEGGSGPNYQNL